MGGQWAPESPQSSRFTVGQLFPLVCLMLLMSERPAQDPWEGEMMRKVVLPLPVPINNINVRKVRLMPD